MKINHITTFWIHLKKRKTKENINHKFMSTWTLQRLQCIFGFSINRRALSPSHGRSVVKYQTPSGTSCLVTVIVIYILYCSKSTSHKMMLLLEFYDFPINDSIYWRINNQTIKHLCGEPQPSPFLNWLR